MFYKERIDLMGLMPDKHLSGNSVNWKNWESKLKFTTCAECFKKHGTIYDTTFERDDIMPIHPNGLCELPFMRTKMAGTVTKLGPLGADAQLCYLKKLPDFYVTKKDALKSGWKRALGNLNDVLPGKSIGGDVFYNDLGKLPSEASRVWREADFDYIKGYSRKELNTARFLKANFRTNYVKKFEIRQYSFTFFLVIAKIFALINCLHLKFQRFWCSRVFLRRRYTGVY